jgi:hypothetical protein
MPKLEARWVKTQEVRAKSKRSAKGARPRFGRSTIWCHVRGGANQGGLHRQSLSMYQECCTTAVRLGCGQSQTLRAANGRGRLRRSGSR